MEELMLLETGLREMHSSELCLRGGASGSLLNEIFTKAKALINFIADYIPKIVKGFIEGFSLRIF